MGRLRPAPTPTRLKVLRDETRPSRLNHAEPQPAGNLPLIPDDLGASAQAVWRRVLNEVGATGVIRAADTDVLRLYCEAVVRYEGAAKLLDQSGPRIRGARSGDLVKNSLHQIVRDNAVLYERVTVAGPEIRSVRLTPAAYAHGLALALPEKVVMARPEGFEPPTV